MDSDWVAIAVSEQVGSSTPLAVVADGREYAVYRDAEGQVRAVDDVCPHRRIPLSLGKIINGNIRCAYHGWTFDGESGQCVAVPNFDKGERISPNFKVNAHQVVDYEGFVYLAVGERIAHSDVVQPVSLPFFGEQESVEDTKTYYGSGVVPMRVEDYSSALIDGPQHLFEISGVRITDFFQSDAQREGDRITIDREAEFGTPTGKATVNAVDRPLLLRSELLLQGNAIIYRLFDDQENLLGRLLLSFTEGKRHTTAICWRFLLHKNFHRVLPVKHRVANRFAAPFNRSSKSPIKVYSSLSGEQIANLIVSASHDCAALMNS